MFAFRLGISAAAFLLFAVQPLLARYILPWFGGQPAVWSTALVFFQTLLLAGYGYAHFLVRRFTIRTQILIHGTVVFAALLLLPITPAAAWKPSPGEDPALRILLLLLASIGLPYLVLSGTSPLLQVWFSRVRREKSPYRLFAWSNAASLLGLLLYPLAIERFLSRSQQAIGWSWGFGLFAMLTAWCALLTWRSRATASAPEPDRQSRRPPATARMLWLALSTGGAILLVAFTNQLSTDVAPVPFLWVLPLTVYLLSFIVTFGSERWYSRRLAVGLLVPALLGLLWALGKGTWLGLAPQIGLYCGALFVLCFALHGELASLRPDSRFLTAYYLTIAAGGAMGGGFVALAAPRLFVIPLELHLGVLFAVLVLMVAGFLGSPRSGPPIGLRWRRGAAIAGFLALALGLGRQMVGSLGGAVEHRRNFYGVLSARWENRDTQGAQMVLQNGQVVHGLQFLSARLSRIPTTYYAGGSGIGIVLRESSGRARRIGVIGLGAGTLATYGRPGDLFRFYEINPEVERMARRYFTFLRDSPARVEMVLGDARLSLEREPLQRFDVLVVDAFSSDAIPTHLLTREAFDLYHRHLAPDGILAVHLTNRHFNLAPVVRAVARSRGWTAVLIVNDDGPYETWRADWMLIAADPGMLRDPMVMAAARAARKAPAPRQQAWTDDFIDIVGALEPARPRVRPSSY